MQYQISAEQILYTILKYDLPGICGPGGHALSAAG